MLPEEARDEVVSALEGFRAGEMGLVDARGEFARLRGAVAEAEGFPAREFLLSVLDATIEGLGSIGLGACFFEYVLDLLGDPSLLPSPPPRMELKEAFGRQSPPCDELHLAKCVSCGREFPGATYGEEGTFEGLCGDCGRLVFLATDDPVRMDLEERAYREHGEPDERMRREKPIVIRELVRRYNTSAGTDPEGPLDVPEEAEKAYTEELRGRLDELRERIGGGWRDVRVQAEILRELSRSVGECPCGGEYVFSPPPPDGDWDRPVCPFCLSRTDSLKPVSRYRYADEHGWSYLDRRRG